MIPIVTISSSPILSSKSIENLYSGVSLSGNESVYHISLFRCLTSITKPDTAEKATPNAKDAEILRLPLRCIFFVDRFA